MIIKTYNNVVYEIFREHGKKVINKVKDFFPYFYVNEEEQVQKVQEVLKVESGFTSIFGDKLKKITMRRPKDVKFFRQQFKKTFEADILYKNRYLIDKVNHQEHNYEYRICFMDIEVDSRKGFPYPERAEYPITIIVCFDTILNKYVIFIWREDLEEKIEKQDEYSVFYFKDEKSMLLKFIKFINSVYPEIITGWNCISFDIQYIINRMKNLNVDYFQLSPFKWVNINKYQIGKDEKIDIAIDGIEIIDLMQVYMKFQYIKAFNPSKKLESYSLKAVSKYEEIGDKYKLDENISLANMWIKDLQSTINYCRHDVYLLLEIEKKLKLFNFIDSIKKVTGCELKDTLTNSRVVDIYILKYAKKHNIILPSVNKNEHEQYEGAIIYTEKLGLIKNIASLDFASMYPSIISTFNMSPEIKNVNNDGITINNIIFSKTKEGMIPKVIKELLEMRYFWKKKQQESVFNSEDYNMCFDRQTAMKVLINSIYGVFGYKNYRLYDRDIAATITFVARELSKKAKEVGEKMNYKSVYIHTDSVFFKLHDDFNIEECINKSKELEECINIEISKLLKLYNIEKSYIKIEFDKFFKSAIFLEDARYIALLVYQDNKFIKPIVRITGFEGIRRDTPKFIRTFLHKFYEKVLQLNDFNEVKTFIKNTIIEIKNQDLNEISITTRLSQNTEDYKTNTQHRRAAEYSNKYLGNNFKRTDYIKLVFIKSIKSSYKVPFSDVVAFDDSTKDKIKEYFEIDWERLVNRILFMKIEKICDSISLDINDLQQNNKGQEVLKHYL